MKLKFNIVFKSGIKNVATATGIKTLDPSEITVAEMRQVLEVEAFLEKLTGLRVHIEQVL